MAKLFIFYYGANKLILLINIGFYMWIICQIVSKNSLGDE